MAPAAPEAEVHWEYKLGGIGTHHVPSLIVGGVLLVERALGPLSAETRGGVFLLAFARRLERWLVR